MGNDNDFRFYNNNKDKFDILEELCDKNFEYFKNDKTENGHCLQNAFRDWANYVQSAHWKVEKIQEFANEYDFDEYTPGNGYRSFITIVKSAVNYGIEMCKNILQTKEHYFFRKNFYVKEVTSIRDLFSSLCTCLEYLFIMHEWSDKGCLFINDKHNAEELFEMSEKLDQYCFYGRCSCLQYTESIRGILRGLSICMASYSESYYSKANKLAKTTSSAWISSKYLLNPELKAKRIVNISHSANIDFCKSFWFLAESEIIQKLPSIFGSSVEVNKVIQIPPEPIQLENVETGELVLIPIPNSHIPQKSIPVRLLSSRWREGMIGVADSRRIPLPQSNHLIIHCHGGGFVAQSSKSHEFYLRDWAVYLNAPIISIDYSLAPEAPYPRALEEVFYVYCWALKNANLLGTTAQKVVVAGDSAGANLCIATIFKCIDYGLRKPDGIFIAYCPVLLDFVPSPARMLCLMDALLPFGFMIRCMRAYTCIDEKAVEAKEDNVCGESGTGVKVKIDTKINIDFNTKEAMEINDDTRRLSTFSTNTVIDEDSKATAINNKSILSDATSDTFASASNHSQAIDNPDLLTPDIPSSCISFEDDSQPIMKLDAETLSNITTPPIDSDEKNLTAFMRDCYTNDNDGNTTITKTPSEENIIIDVVNNEIYYNSHSLPNRLHKVATDFVNLISTTLKSFTNSSEISPLSTSEHSSSSPTLLNRDNIKNLDLLIARNPNDELDFKIPRDHYISPYIASDEYLRQMPATCILTIDMDPCLDDGIMFAKRLRNVGCKVKIDILEGLPHGFLNFTMLSNEANEGSKVCAQRILELLNNNNEEHDNFKK